MRIAIVISVLLLYSFTGIIAGTLDPKFKQFVAEFSAKGTVLDDYGHPLKGVIISAKNSTISVISDEKGSFEINVIQGSVLIFSYHGFNTQEVKISNNKPVIVMLTKNYLQNPDTINVLFGVNDADKNLGS